MPRKRKYEELFIYEPNGLARCRRGGCSHPTMPRAQSNGMKKHIQVHHPDDYLRFLTLAKEGQADGAPSEGSRSAHTSAHPLELFTDHEDHTISGPPRQLRRVILEESDTDEDDTAQVQPAVHARGSATRTQSLESFSEGPASLDNGDYLVERVEAMRFSGREVLWFVKWAGWPEEYSSWEPQAHLASPRKQSKNTSTSFTTSSYRTYRDFKGTKVFAYGCFHKENSSQFFL